jgi:hypothetical protein
MASLREKEIPIELDNRYFTEGIVKVREAGKSFIYFNYELKAVEDRSGYYRVVMQLGIVRVSGG